MVPESQNEVHLQDVAQIAFTVQNLTEAKIFYRDVLELNIRSGNHGFLSMRVCKANDR
jgi:catechol 2,3-dioxygenase-like lactoylglutathione lyase family enzyme